MDTVPALAYGLAISAPGLDTGMSVSGPGDWPAVTLRQDPEPLVIDRDLLDGERAEFALADGTHWLRAERVGGHAVLHGPPIPDDELGHPYLWPVASVFSRWLGREAFHAGAVLIDGGAWVLIGPKEAGKSTLLAAHAARGGGVLTDDLVVVDGERVFAGPRFIDLRQPLPESQTADLRPTRGGTRLRVTLPAIAPEVPLRGWLFLRWGERTELSRVAASVCLARLARWRAWGELLSDPRQILAFAGLPAYEFVRERDWASLHGSLELLDSLGGG